MDPTNISAIGIQLTNLTNNIVSIITFKDVYSYLFVEILIISFYIAMEANRVESIKTLLNVIILTILLVKFVNWIPIAEMLVGSILEWF